VNRKVGSGVYKNRHFNAHNRSPFDANGWDEFYNEDLELLM